MKKRFTKELVITQMLLAATLTFTGLFYSQLAGNLNLGNMSGFTLGVMVTYIIIASFIIYGNLIYHLTRIGLFSRLRWHKVGRLEIRDSMPLVTYLIPAYKEELKVIEQTIWSAILQNYPNKRIVLLIDNPPHTKVIHDLVLLENTREMVVKINNLVKELKRPNSNIKESLKKLASEHMSDSHVDKFFVEKIVNKYLHDKDDFRYVFNTEVTSFERKLYKNLSHEPNKAMNINSYLNLIGKKVRRFSIGQEQYIEETLDPSSVDKIPDSKYVITLDADSMLLPYYTIKMVTQMEKEENQKVAVIQTPYSAYPGATNPVELIAGATTDIQYNIHQGFTYYNSTYWVGANAMLRKKALDDIKMYEVQDNKLAVKYVQDRTVIEDTESSIDLVDKGWKLLNYPERLAYSSTPPDFGSLIIQRERWANGGLIIFPKLLRYILKKPLSMRRWVEFFVRSNYLVSIAGINIGTLLLLLYPFSDNVFTFWLPLASIPYYFLYTRDLIQLGYKLSDIVRIYAMNLILIPINVAGVIKSIQQGLTGSKIPFKRTPKVGNRVASEVKFVISLYGLFLYTVWATIWDIVMGHWSHVAYSAINGAMIFYAIKTFLGFKESWEDLRAQLNFRVKKAIAFSTLR